MAKFGLGDFQILKDVQSLGIKDLLSAYGAINQSKIDAGFAKSQNFINELKAQEGLLRLKTQVEPANVSNLLTQPDWKKYAGYALIIGGLAGAAWLLVKK